MKGTVSDLLIIMLVVLILATTFGILYFISQKLNEGMSSVLPNYALEKQEKATIGLGILFNSLPFLTIILGITSIILAFQIPAHPIFAPISIFILALYILLSTVFSNIFYNLGSNTILTSVFNQFPLVVYIMQYLPYVIAILGVLIIIVQYSKVGGSE
ncbi:MAG: hypothetical protein QW228_05975 [Candidatus Aenigmatarchaeota archaeon]